MIKRRQSLSLLYTNYTPEIVGIFLFLSCRDSDLQAIYQNTTVSLNGCISAINDVHLPQVFSFDLQEGFHGQATGLADAVFQVAQLFEFFTSTLTDR